MVRGIFPKAVCAAMVLCGASLALRAAPDETPPSQPEFLAQMRALNAHLNTLPDMPGTGPYPAIKEVAASLPDHVVYRPADLSKVPPGTLGILAWGNGGCSGDGASARLHLLQIASHGYVAVAPGAIQNGPGSTPPPPLPPADGPDTPARLSSTTTTHEQVAAGIDWAIAQNSDPDSPLKGKIDTKAVGVAGWSCGALQAMTIATTDTRVRAIIIQNSGIFPEATGMREMDVGKPMLDRLRTPILYIEGGKRDVAYDHGFDDYQRIAKVPVVFANLRGVGHGGTYTDANGGRVALVALAWLDWQLKGDAKAGSMFSGDKCGLCTDPAWSVRKKGF